NPPYDLSSCLVGSDMCIRERYKRYGESEEEDTEGEVLVRRQEEKTWTVVGIYERFSYEVEPYSCPGYTVLTGGNGLAEEAEDVSYQIAFTLRNRKEIISVMSELNRAGLGTENEYHSGLLRMDGISGMRSFTRVFNGLAIILCIIIVFGSVALIYNAFSISVNERMKQFGLLASVGATKRQMRKSIRFEACAVSVIGIPLGILAGIVGMSITFYALRYRFVGLFSSSRIPLTLQADWQALLIAAVLAFVTVLVSAAIPARRAMRVPVIEAIRQNNVIQVPNKRLRTPGFLYRLFGIPGVLADKNFRRNRKKYRATVISLFVSIVLFISASSFVDYLRSSVDSVAEAKNYDFQYYTYREQKHTAEEIRELLADTEGIAESSVHIRVFETFMFDQSAMDQSFFAWAAAQHSYSFEEELFLEATGRNGAAAPVRLYFLPDREYRAYTEKNGLAEQGYFGTEKNALVYDNILQYVSGRYTNIRYLKEESGTLSAFLYELIWEETPSGGKNEDPGEEAAKGADSAEDEEAAGSADGPEDEEEVAGSADIPEREPAGMEEPVGEMKLYPGEEKLLNYRVTDAELPMGLEKSLLSFVYPESAIAELFPEFSDDMTAVVSLTASGDPDAVYEKLEARLLASAVDTGPLYNLAERDSFQRNLILIVNVFSYGFIALISLIAAANVFNTISTNISLRRREFAMLESIGMTRKALYGMLNYECLLYGIKSLLYGMPVALLLTFAIYRVVNEGYVTDFYVPAASIAIAVVSVFAVVFATMFYAAGKLRKNSVVETLKNENV
ncbi:MAG: FtsX-like permease family protein, partial [Lachnospiraceae bacterium]|nr:FtsX-like permease family protein [Lachnospiraceae bacterium]